MTDFLFRQRFWIIALIFWIGFALYFVDAVNTAEALVRWAMPTTPPDGAAMRTALREVFGASATVVVAGTLLRTWGTAYLQADVVHDPALRSDTLVASGPFRYVRNPLYLGSILFAVGYGMMASRLGFAVIVIGMAVLLRMFIAAEEATLTQAYPTSYMAYQHAVPRLVPSLVPRVARGTAAPQWRQAFRGEAFMWIFSAAAVGFAITLRPRVIWMLTLAAILLQGLLFGRRGRTTPPPQPPPRGA